MTYLFDEPKDTACIVCTHVMEGERPILYALHNAEDGFWQFLCGENDHHTDDSYKLISLEEATIIDASINDVCNLPVGSSIRRATEFDEWKT